MKLKDSSIICFVILTWIFIAIGVIGADTKMTKYEQEIAELYSHEDSQDEYILAIDRTNAEANAIQDARLDEIEWHNKVQDYRLTMHREEIEEYASVITDILSSQERLEEYCRSLPDNIYGLDISEEEEYLIASLVYLEAGADSCSYDLKKAVASVFFNQMLYFGTDVHQTIYRAGAFSVASRVRYTTPSPSCRAAVRYVLENGYFPRNVIGFQTGGYHRDFGHPYCRIQNVYFSAV